MFTFRLQIRKSGRCSNSGQGRRRRWRREEKIGTSLCHNLRSSSVGHHVSTHEAVLQRRRWSNGRQKQCVIPRFYRASTWETFRRDHDGDLAIICWQERATRWLTGQSRVFALMRHWQYDSLSVSLLGNVEDDNEIGLLYKRRCSLHLLILVRQCVWISSRLGSTQPL